MQTPKKAIILTLDVATEKQILAAEKMQNKLYRDYKYVTVTPVGLCKIQLVASGLIKT